MLLGNLKSERENQINNVKYSLLIYTIRVLKSQVVNN
jgi:hypothetical protein